MPEPRALSLAPPPQPGQPPVATAEIDRARVRAAVMHPAFAGLPSEEKLKIAAVAPDPPVRQAIRALTDPRLQELDARERLKIVQLLPGFRELDPRAQAVYFQRVAYPERTPPGTFESKADRFAKEAAAAPTEKSLARMEIAEAALRIPASIGKGVLTVAGAGLHSLGVPTEKVLKPAGEAFEAGADLVRAGMEKAADAARPYLPESLAAKDSSSTVLNFIKLLPDFSVDVAGKWISENVQALDSIGAVASLGLTAGAASAIRKGTQLVLAGNVAQGVKIIAAAAGEAVASPAQTGKAVARGVGELVTGVPARRTLPETLGGAVGGPTGERILSVAGRVGEKVTLPASVAEPLRRYAAPKNFDERLLRGPASATRVATELLAPIGSTLPKELQPARRVLLAETEEGLRTAVSHAKDIAAKHMTAESRAAASQIVEARLAGGVGAKGAAKLAKELPEAQALALESVQTTNRLARELTAAGFPPSVFQRFKDAYLGRFYLSKELPTETMQALAEAIGNGKVPAGGITVQDARRLMERGEIPEAVRKQLLEVTDAGYRLIRTEAQERTLAAFGRFQQKIAAAPGVVWKQVSKRKTPRPVPPGYVKLAEGPRMIPALKGAYVPFDVAREIALYDGVVLEYASENFARKTMSLWKEVVTVDNPAVWTGNIITNMLLLGLNRIGGPLSAPAFLRSAAADIARDKLGKASSPEMALARKMGLFDETSQHRNALRGELARFLAEDIEAGTLEGMAIQHSATMHRPFFQKWLEGAAKGAPPGAALGAAVGQAIREAPGVVRRGAQDFYRAQDDIFKYVAFKDGLARGLKPDAALVRAREMFVDYSTLPMAIRRIGSSPISVMPFISWQYGIAPQLVKAAASNPFAMQRWSHALDAWNSAAAMSLGESPETLERIKEARVQAFDTRLGRFFADNMALMILPVRTAAGDLMVIDLTRWNPYGTLISGRALSLSPLVLGFLEAATGVRYYGTTPVGPIRSSEALAEAARVLAIPPPFAAELLKIGVGEAAKSTNPELRDAAIKVLKVMFGAQGFGSPYGKPQGLLGRLAGAVGVRVVPTNLKLERGRGGMRVEQRVQRGAAAVENMAEREKLFRQRLPAIPGQPR